MIPTPHVVGLRTWKRVGADSRGNDVWAHGAAADWRVHFIAPASAVEASIGGHDEQVTDDLEVGAPADGLRPGPRDRVVIDGREFNVIGHPQDFSHGPWRFPDAGIIVRLRRVEG